MELELAAALRAWRDRVTPGAVGVASGAGRRVPGLRREELAALAGVSVDYLVRLEQGRARNPSPQVIGALAHALRLTVEERDALYRMAGVAPPSAGTVPRHVPPGIQRMIDRLADTALAVYTSGWEIVQWNALWAALLGDPSPWQGRERNLVWRVFTVGEGRVHHEKAGRDAFESGIVADLHIAVGRYPDDRELVAMIAELRRRSARFATLWDRYELAPGTSTRKTIRHPLIGSVDFDCDVLTVPGSDLRIVVYTAAPGSAAADGLALLRVTGIQELESAEPSGGDRVVESLRRPPQAQ